MSPANGKHVRKITGGNGEFLSRLREANADIAEKSGHEACGSQWGQLPMTDGCHKVVVGALPARKGLHGNLGNPPHAVKDGPIAPRGRRCRVPMLTAPI